MTVFYRKIISSMCAFVNIVILSMNIYYYILGGRVQNMRLKIRRPRRHMKTKIWLVIVISAVLSVIMLYSMKTSTMLREVAQSELESIAFDIISTTAEEELSKDGMTYTDFVNIEKDEDGRISAVSANMQKINLLKLRISNRLSDEMFNRVEDTVRIPLGNLSGIDMLTGLGPRLKFRALWVSGVDAKFHNTFTQAGINQTRHQIMLDFSINVGMMFAGREIGVDVSTGICVAETIIVGETPEFFAAMAEKS